MRSVGLLRVCILAGICLSAVMAQAQRLSFIGVALDRETREADRRLEDYLHRRAGIDLSPEELEYGQVIDRLSNWKPGTGGYIARVTPYVHVASEMLGAGFETLATYVGATTNRRTYSSYFVVNRKHFSSPPDLDTVVHFLTRSTERPRFVYHSKFSTSSFFLPSLFLREHSIYAMDASTESLTAISSEQVGGGSSTALVKLVAQGKADFAAVWDGTRNKFLKDSDSGYFEEFGRHVYFIRLPIQIPNDLLICSIDVDPKVRAALKKAISEMGPTEIGVGDFESWTTMTEATEARRALADLRWKARGRSAPVIVDIREEQGTALQQPLLDTVRQAIRLSGSELVLYDEDFHQHIDYSWTLKPIHDGALSLNSSLPGSDIEDQVFRISFRDEDDLTQRIVSIINTRLNRIRQVWPYSTASPLLIRDTALPISAGDEVKVQRITWIDPQRNAFRGGPIFDSVIQEAGLFRYRLRSSDFPDSEAFDAMSNVSFRVFLLRSNEEKPIFRYLTGVLLLLFVGAGLVAVWEFRRTSSMDMESSKTFFLQSS